MEETIRQYVELIVEDVMGLDGIDVDASLSIPSLMVEPDVKEKIKDYFGKMGLTRGKKSRVKRVKRGSAQDTTKKNLWRTVDVVK